MTTRKAIKVALERIHTNLYDQSTPPKMLNINQFGSFLDNNQPLPSNAELLHRAAAKGVELTPSSIGHLQYDRLKPSEGEGLAGATDLRLTDVSRDSRQVNRAFMFVAENLAVRTDPEASHGAPYSMFHDLTRPTNTYKLYVEVNDRRLQGAYVTDAVKNTAESNSGHFEKAFLIGKNTNLSLLTWRKHPRQAIAKLMQVYKDKNHTYQIAQTAAEAEVILAANEQTFQQSAAIFAQECHIIRPKQLVTFGGGAANVLRQMRPLFAADPAVLKLVDRLVIATHYAYRGYGTFHSWAEKSQPDLLARLGLDQANSQPFV